MEGHEPLQDTWQHADSKDRSFSKLKIQRTASASTRFPRTSHASRALQQRHSDNFRAITAPADAITSLADQGVRLNAVAGASDRAGVSGPGGCLLDRRRDVQRRHGGCLDAISGAAGRDRAALQGDSTLALALKESLGISGSAGCRDPSPEATTATVEPSALDTLRAALGRPPATLSSGGLSTREGGVSTDPLSSCQDGTSSLEEGCRSRATWEDAGASRQLSRLSVTDPALLGFEKSGVGSKRACSSPGRRNAGRRGSSFDSVFGTGSYSCTVMQGDVQERPDADRDGQDAERDSLAHRLKEEALHRPLGTAEVAPAPCPHLHPGCASLDTDRDYLATVTPSLGEEKLLGLLDCPEGGCCHGTRRVQFVEGPRSQRMQAVESGGSQEPGEDSALLTCEDNRVGEEGLCRQEDTATGALSLERNFKVGDPHNVEEDGFEMRRMRLSVGERSRSCDWRAALRGVQEEQDKERGSGRDSGVDGSAGAVCAYGALEPPCDRGEWDYAEAEDRAGKFLGCSWAEVIPDSAIRDRLRSLDFLCPGSPTASPKWADIEDVGTALADHTSLHPWDLLYLEGRPNSPVGAGTPNFSRTRCSTPVGSSSPVGSRDASPVLQRRMTGVRSEVEEECWLTGLQRQGKGEELELSLSELDQQRREEVTNKFLDDSISGLPGIKRKRK